MPRLCQKRGVASNSRSNGRARSRSRGVLTGMKRLSGPWRGTWRYVVGEERGQLVDEPLELDGSTPVDVLLHVEPRERVPLRERVDLDHEAVRVEDRELMRVEGRREAEALDDLRPAVDARGGAAGIALRVARPRS